MATLVVERGTEVVAPAIRSQPWCELGWSQQEEKAGYDLRTRDRRMGPALDWAESNWAGPGEEDSLCPLKWVPLSTLFLAAVESIPPVHPHVNPPSHPFKIPHAEWSRIVQRVAQGESLRQVARCYRVSYEAIRRILAAARRSHVQNDKAPLEEERLDE